MARGPSMLVSPRVEYQTRVEVLQTAKMCAMQARMDREGLQMVSPLVLDCRVDVSRRALAGESVVDVKLLPCLRRWASRCNSCKLPTAWEPIFPRLQR